MAIRKSIQSFTDHMFFENTRVDNYSLLIRRVPYKDSKILEHVHMLNDEVNRHIWHDMDTDRILRECKRCGFMLKIVDNTCVYCMIENEECHCLRLNI